jgi:hypothetical protein
VFHHVVANWDHCKDRTFIFYFPCRWYSQALVNSIFRRYSSSPSRKKLRAWWSSPRACNPFICSQSQFPFPRVDREKESGSLLQLMNSAYFHMPISSSLWHCGHMVLMIFLFSVLYVTSASTEMKHTVFMS